MDAASSQPAAGGADGGMSTTHAAGGHASGSGGSGHTGSDAGGGGQDAQPALDAGNDAAVGASLPTYDAFCQRMAEQTCALLTDCCDTSDLDPTLCARYERYTYDMPNQAGCGPGGTEPESFDRTAAETCVELTRDSYTDCGPKRRDAPGQIEREQTCAKVATLGLPGPGEECFASSECMSPPGTFSVCEFGTDGQPDLCSDAQPRAARGEPCSSNPCREDLACVLLATTQQPVCGDPQPDGSPCRSDLGCASGACKLKEDIGIGECRSERPKIEGSVCAELSGLAQYGLYAENAGRVWVNDHDMVWIGTQQFFRAPKDGSGPVTAKPLPAGAEGYVFDDAHLYAFNQNHKQVFVVALESGASETIDLGFSGGDLAIDADNIYVAEESCVALTRIAKKDRAITRSTAQLPAAPDTRAVPIALLQADSDAVYCANRFALLRYTIDSNADAELIGTLRDADAGFVIMRLIVGNDRIWIDAQTLSGQDRLLQSSKSAGALTESSDMLLDVGNGAFDRARNRWVSANSDGIVVYSIADATTQTLPAQPIAAGSPIALDSDFIYWTYRAATLRRATD